MSITIYSAGGTLKYTLKAIQTSRLHQSLNGECLFDFAMPGRMISGIVIGDQVRLGNLWFYVCRIGKQTLTAGAEFSVSCEHVSYSLADVTQDAAHFSGTPAAVLETILAGTGFSAGTVTVSGEWSITINQATNKRTALQQWAAECGAEISYSGMSINFLSRVGSSVPVNLSEAENVKSLSVTLDSRSSTQTYAVELSRLQTVSLGDAVKIRYASLDLDVSTRVIALDYDPFHPWLISMTTGDYAPNFTGAVSAALEARLKEGAPYFGVTIDKESGIKIQRSDGLSEAVFNSDLFSMRALIDGVMKDRIYFDPIKGDYIFDGALGADAVFTDSLYAETGEIAELTVDRLSTSRRIRKYILGDTSDDNFVRIQDQYIQFVTGTVIDEGTLTTERGFVLLTEDGDPLVTESNAGAVAVQAQNRYGQGLYWQREPVGHTSDGYPTDIDGVQIYAGTEATEWPVYVWQYAELVKASIAFEEYTTTQGDQTYAPVIVLGAGDENGNSKGYFLKEQNEMIVRYLTGDGEETDIRLSDFVDAKHRRLASCEIDTANGEVTYTVEGDEMEYSLTFVVDGDSVTYTWPDGHECVVNVT